VPRTYKKDDLVFVPPWLANILVAAGAIELVNYHALKDVACDYVKSRVASGGLTKPP
jgi:hypothetical protein